MSFEIHGFAPIETTDPSAGLLVLRFSEPTSAERVDELTHSLRDAGVLEADGSAIAGGSLAALPWRVPSSAEIDKQRSALSSISGVAEAWAFAQSAETDLSDWFAPRWRCAPPQTTASFEEIARPERVSWEGFGIAMSFGRELDDGDRDIVRALAQLWLTAYSDRGGSSEDAAESPLGSRCYQRAVIAPHGSEGIIIGLEGLANPGTDEEAIGHLLWLVEQIGLVLPVADVRFMSLLPQASESGETIAPAKVLERATREWSVADVAGAVLDADRSTASADDEEADEPAEEVEEADEPAEEVEVADEPAEEAEEAAEPAEAEEADDDDDDAPDEWALEDASDGVVEASTNGVSTQVAVELAQQIEESDVSQAFDAVLDMGETLDEPETITDDGDAEAVDMDLEVDVDAPAPDDAPDLDEHEHSEVDDEQTVAGTGDVALIAALEAGDLPGALAAFDSSSDKTGAAAILLDVIEGLDASDWDDLQPILEIGSRVITTNPESSNAHLQMIAALCRLGRGDEAIEIGLGYIDRPEVLWETFERLCVFRRTDDIEPLLPKLAESGHEGVGNHYYNLGCKLHLTQPEVAIALYRGAIACGSPRPQADINTGLALIGLGRYDDAVTVTRAALEACGDEPNLWANLIDVLSRIDSPDLDASIERAREVLAGFDDDEADAPAASERGWGALVADMADAILLRGKDDDASAALELIAATSAEQPITTRVAFARARALAGSGDTDGALEILDHVSTADATSTAYYRARANVMFHLGNSEAAVGLACAAVMTDKTVLELMRRDPLASAISELSLSDDGSPPRPPSVPAEATWVASDGEWELGPRDDDGEKHGPFRYFRADGTLCNECTMVHGKPHGDFARFHESGEISQKGAFEDGELHGTRTWLASPVTTSEQMHNEQISMEIRRSEMDYVAGRVVGVRHYNGEGVLCAPNGEPYPDRPGDVTEDAFFRTEDDEWVAGEVDNDGQRRGVWRRWNVDGVLLEESEFAAGERHGSFKAYFLDGTLSAEGQYIEGDKTGTFVYQRRGEQEHEDFPVAAESITLAEESHESSVPVVRLYDKAGRESTIDATPLEDWTAVHPELESWFNELWQVPWPELDDASGNAHRVPHLLLGLLADDDDLNQYVYRALYWHLYNEGNVYSGTAAAMPFLIRLAQARGVPQLTRLCNFIRHTGCWPAGALEEAAESGVHAVISTNEALMKRIDAFVPLLGHDDPGARAAAGAVLAGAHNRADEMSSQLSGAFATEESEMVRASHMFSLARFGTPEALFVVEAQLGAGSDLVGAAAAMALVMTRGEEAGERVAARLVSSLVNYNDAMGEAYGDSPWSDDHLVTEMAQALHYACEGNTALERLTAAFPTVTTTDGVAAVAASLMIASASGDGLTDEIRATLRAIADTTSLWELGDAVAELLDGYELPSNPDELRALADQ